MEIILNSKFFGTLSIEELGTKTGELGFDGLDINIRPNHPVNPDNAIKMLPKAVKQWADIGISCPLATAPIDMVDPHSPDAIKLFEACAAAEVPRLKLGFWRFAPGDNYWQSVDQARSSLEFFGKLSKNTGVQTCYQVHSGANLGSNCAGLMHLLQGFEPDLVGGYPDVGHMSLDGEDWAMGFAMLGKYLSVVGAKDAHHAPNSRGKTPPYIPKFVKLGDGSIDWARCLEALIKLGFDGPISVHTEYDFDETIIRQVGYADITPPNLEELARHDAHFLKHEIELAKAKVL